MLLFAFLGLTIGLLGVRAIDLFLNIKLGCALDNVVSRPLNVNSRVLGISILLDGVAFVGLDSDLAMLFDLGNLTTRASTTPFPGDCTTRVSTDLKFQGSPWTYAGLGACCAQVPAPKRERRNIRRPRYAASVMVWRWHGMRRNVPLSPS